MQLFGEGGSYFTLYIIIEIHEEKKRLRLKFLVSKFLVN